jgi:hypothetical protein
MGKVSNALTNQILPYTSDIGNNMNDTERLDWINEHMSAFRCSVRDEGNMPMDMTWISDSGASFITRGENIRHCITNAMSKTVTYPKE